LTKNEVIRIIGEITIAYPNFDKFRDEKHIAAMVGLWADYFAEDNANIVSLAVRKHVMTSKWPPSVNEIRETMVSILYPDIIDCEEAWVAVTKALYLHGEYDDEKVLRSLPATISGVVKAIGIATLRQHAGKHDGLDHVAFKDMYEKVIRRQRDYAMLPPSLRRQIDEKAQTFETGEREKLFAIAEKAAEKEKKYKLLEHAYLSRMSEDAGSGLTERKDGESDGQDRGKIHQGCS